MSYPRKVGPLRVARWIGRYARRRWPGLLGVSAAMVFEVGLGLAKPWPLKVLIDNALLGHPARGVVGQVLTVLPSGQTRSGLITWAVIGGALLVLGAWVTEAASSYLGVVFRRRIAGDVAEDLFAHVQRLSLRSHHHFGIGDMVRRLTVDAEAISGVTSDAVLPVGMASVNLVGMVAIMVSLDAPLALLALGVTPFLAWSLRRYAGPMLDRSYEQHQAEGRLYRTVEQTFSAVTIVQAFDRHAEHDERFADDRQSVVQAAVTTTATQLRFQVSAGLATAVGTGAVFWIGGHQALSGSLSLGTIIVFLTYLTSLYGPLESMVYAVSTIQQAAGSARRVLEVLDAVPEPADGPRSLSGVSGRLAFDRVGFAYRGDLPALKGVTFEIAPGEVVGVVGSTGAGKSTLLALAARLFDPDDGAVRLDGADLRELSLRSLRQQVGMVFQESFLFPVSVAENISYGRPGASLDQVVRAATLAGADGFIRRLPSGYDTVLGDRGATLSGGERQRLALARAVVRDPPVLLLDEPTSALDARTEAEVMSAIRQAMAGRTTVIVAHRLSTVAEADRIIVLEAGQVVEVGSPAELLRADGSFTELWHHQRGGVQVGSSASAEGSGPGGELVLG